MAVELYIARHGQNEDNVNGVLNGHRDLPLTDLGRDQARQLAEGILAAGKPTDKIAELCAPDIIVTDTITYFLSPEGAETFPQLLERGARALEEVIGLQKEGRALIVCHGDIGKMIYAAATGKTWRDVLTGFHFGNCELIDLEPNGNAHVIRLPQYNL